MVLLIRYALSFTLLHYGQPRDSRIGEHVIFVRAACREFGHNGAFRTGLEPVRRIRTQRILIARPQAHFVPAGEVFLRTRGSLRRRLGRRRAWNIKIHHAPAATEGLLLPRLTAYRGMPVLGTRLPREHHNLLRATAVCVDVSNDLEPGLLEFVQTEVGHFETR